MKRIYHGKNLEIGIYPSGKDQAEVGMYVELDNQGWKSNLFVPDSTIARLVTREMYYSMVCEFYPDDFQSRPSTPDSAVVFKKVRRRSSSSRSRKSPHEIGVEAEVYDKNIIDSVEVSSMNADIGECRLRVEKAVFHYLQSPDFNFLDSSKIWWDLKYKLVLLYICWKQGLLKLGSVRRESIFTLGDLFSIWKTRSGMNETEMFYTVDNTLTSLGQAVMESVDSNGMVMKMFSNLKSNFWLQDEFGTMGVQNANTVPEVEGQMLLENEQGKIIQVVLVVILFAVLVSGVASFMAENKKIMNILQDIRNNCKS